MPSESDAVAGGLRALSQFFIDEETFGETVSTHLLEIKKGLSDPEITSRNVGVVWGDGPSHGQRMQRT